MGNGLATAMHTKQEPETEEIRLHRRLKTVCSLLVKAETNIFGRAARTSAFPAEILALIFRLAQSADESLAPASCAILLSHVSQRWRQIAIRTARLWCDIRVLPSTSKVLLEAQILRSQACTLYVQLSEISSETARIPAAHISLVLSRIIRVQSLVILTRRPQTVFDVFQTLQAVRAPALDRMIVDLQPTSGEILPPTMTIFGAGAPRLSSLSLRGISTMSCRPPMSAMTQLRLDSVNDTPFVVLTCEELRAMLTACSQTLLGLSFCGIIVQFSRNDCLSRIDMPSLVSLEFRPDTGPSPDKYLQSLFAIIWAPALTCLKLGTSSLQDHHLQSLLMTMQSSVDWRITYATLRSLKISHTVRSYDSGRSMTEVFPSISHLELNTSDADILFKILDDDSALPPSERDNLWPELRSMTLPVLDSQNLNLGRLRKLISGRAAIGRPIRDLCLVSYDKDDIVPRTHVEWLGQHVNLTLRCDQYPESNDNVLTQ